MNTCPLCGIHPEHIKPFCDIKSSWKLQNVNELIVSFSHGKATITASGCSDFTFSGEVT
uniref:Uncharacterized protein n=1 Tax=Rhizobium rhizogenes TaxID=359 RepID=A0A4P8DKA6_RHIRH|nr:hypothetical protein pOC-C5.8_612 [Rhizobium rhizogenes]